jgi:hypothetical protein
MISSTAFCGAPVLRVSHSGARARVPVCRRPRTCATADASSDTAQSKPEAVAADAPVSPTSVSSGGDNRASYISVPGKIQFTPDELAAQRVKLDKLAAKFKQERLQREYEDSQKFGFVKNAERFNGRLAMFFFVVGLLTEYWTGYTIPQQIELMLNTVGVYF